MDEPLRLLHELVRRLQGLRLRWVLQGVRLRQRLLWIVQRGLRELLQVGACRGREGRASHLRTLVFQPCALRLPTWPVTTRIVYGPTLARLLH